MRCLAESLTPPCTRLKSVVLVSESVDGKGGASVAALRSASILAQSGLSLRLFAATGPFAHDDLAATNLSCVTLSDGYDLIRAPVLARATRSLWNTEAARKLGEVLCELEPSETIVHVHSFSVNLTAAVIREARKRGFAVVMTSHDYAIACPYSGFYHYGIDAPCGKRALSAGCLTTLCTSGRSIPGKAWHVAKALVQRAGGVPGGVDHFVFVSEFSRQKLVPYLPRGAKTTVIENPLDLPKDPPRELRSDAPFLFVGRLTREKGCDVFLEAANTLGVDAWVVGSGSEEERLRQRAPSATLFGWKSAREARELMRQARALVFPSRCYEGQPLTVQEAQSVGLPVICSDACAARGSIRHGHDGLLFRSGDAGDLARQMHALMDDARAQAMGLAAYEAFWEDPPTAEKHLRKTLEVYEEVLSSRR